MILGIGVDVSEPSRFQNWKNYSHEKLLKVFSEEELSYLSKECGASVEQFFASRFAAKEAFFKALSTALVNLGLNSQTFPFEFARKHVEVVKSTWDLPILKVDWEAFEEKIRVSIPKMEIYLSLSHEKSLGIAFVILS